MKMGDLFCFLRQLLVVILPLTLLVGCATSSTKPTTDISKSSPSRQIHNKAKNVFGPGIAKVKQTSPAQASTQPHAAKKETPAQPKDIWARLRAGFSLPEYRDKHVIYYEEWYSSRPELMRDMTARARLYLAHFTEQVEKRGFPTEIALLPAVESAYKPFAYSRAGAAGLWQFMPATGKRFGLRSNWWYDGRYDVTLATRAALDYLSFLNQEFDGDWFHALSGYNAGEARVGKAIKRNRQRGKSTSYQYLDLPSETKRYVPKLIAIRNIIREPEKFGVTLSNIPNAPYFAQIDVGSQIELGVVAELANESTDIIRALNPAYRQWMTGPSGPHHILLPKEREPSFKVALNKLPKDKRIRWAYHTIRRGDVLGKIANRYGVSVADIRTSNGLKSNRIYPGKRLKIPVSASRTTAVARASTQSTRTSKKKVHRIRKGDTLWNLSKRYGVSLTKLKKWNGLSSRSILSLGQRVVIYN